MLKSLKYAIIISLFSHPIMADTLPLGRIATPQEIQAWDIDIRPDGLGLPTGRGDVLNGEEIFANKCAVCHGDFGEAVDRWPILSGGQGSLTEDRPVKTVGSYWPYLSTAYDYIYRAMPFGNAQSLTPDEVYAIIAYILYVNDVVDEDFELSNENFLDVQQENVDNFFMDDRPSVEYPKFKKTACMQNCKEQVQIIKRAAIIDVTPEETTEKAISEDITTEDITTTPSQEVPVTLDEALVAKGKKLFRKCKACHKVGAKAKNGTGPILNNIYNAPFAYVETFKYSNALKKAAGEGNRWDEENLHAFLKAPRRFIKGTKMSFAGLKKEKERAAIIEYLKSVSQ